MSDEVDVYRGIKDHKKRLREKFGVACPRCAIARPRAPASILLPQQRCRVDGYTDTRPPITDDQWRDA